jgi:protein-tyrosine phosphatase
LQCLSGAIQRYKLKRLREAFRRERHSIGLEMSHLGDKGCLLFVCDGNICRSPFAERYWSRRLREAGYAGPSALSSGFNSRAGRRSPLRISRIAAERGVDLDGHRSRYISAENVAAADAIFVMDDKNLHKLLSHFPECTHKTYLLRWFARDGGQEIADPYTIDDDGVRECFTKIVESIDGLLAVIKQTCSGSRFG